ncbi:hypothetical protein A3F00_04905 [Candidatus Daviesbacteria bacterium RIFCSPHIGHO2_12_FULL_37_11]|uniref:DUF4446 domain-containing protein n=1 Tax=Candidatus Daviesbacteria bacterium RIFCSPHIGHO2_12_FULL_37_11 TaxID=1797777 RepID=A0A1F5K9J8_9BACT|nr:MAG: hypothetical protein A2769_04650 [Candidatus Daviesbacteria bacterium RIFCSPHIGHO2_01_FULL_37_27]OGE37576.1 MAG: hypothetical protein A3F00_04905 [Candidatus Daviesbacteria bacterium RIFCSPHIGHO2_12_FULL_37_11]OGE46014.1 MAG: hypothetical protein A3B39_03315 [Candidatus Daviesbacteria bacterium RIFCSPLOWO2_01_FULL_37_10]
MYSDWVLTALGGIIFIWLGFLSFFVWKQNDFLGNLFPKSGERDIRKKFEETVKIISQFKGDLGDLKNKLSEIEQAGLKYIQRVELIRFNPYEDTGGDQSFAVTFLDNKGNGFVITSLHSRSGTRVFAKEVTNGRSGKYEFSKEEEEVVRKALRLRSG